MIDIIKIIEMLPHRYPLLLVDRILEIEHNKTITGLKNVTFNEPHFAGHFPDHPIMPGVLIIEALAQVSAALIIESNPERCKGNLVYFTSIDKVKFRRPVTPGDSLHLHAEMIRNRGNLWQLKVHATVEGKKVTEAIISAMMMERENA